MRKAFAAWRVLRAQGRFGRARAAVGTNLLAADPTGGPALVQVREATLDVVRTVRSVTLPPESRLSTRDVAER
jgi:hypothetical protein